VKDWFANRRIEGTEPVAVATGLLARLDPLATASGSVSGLRWDFIQEERV
jgi:hypothetical protein